MVDESASQEIDAIIQAAEGWKGKKLTELRAIVGKADPDILEEVKWKMPSKPQGVPVWSYNGILCHADVLKKSVRLTFHNGVKMKDPKKLFNARLDSKTVRAIDFLEEDRVDKTTLRALVLEAVRVNAEKARK